MSKTHCTFRAKDPWATKNSSRKMRPCQPLESKEKMSFCDTTLASQMTMAFRTNSSTKSPAHFQF